MTSSVEAFQLHHGDQWTLSYFRAWFEFHAIKSHWIETKNPVGIVIGVINPSPHDSPLHALPGDWVIKNGDGWEVRTDVQWGRKRGKEE